jgi:Cu2+-exporting ATPase
MQVSPTVSTAVTPTTTASTCHTVTLDVGGMKCAGCVKAVENQLVQHSGVVSATVNLVTEVATVKCQPGQVEPASLAEKLTEIGFPTQLRAVEGAAIAPDSEKPPDLAEQQRAETRQHFQRMAIAATLLLLSTIGHLDHFGWAKIPGFSNIWFHFGLATLTLIFPGRPILIDGWRGLRHNIPNMNTLVSLGTLTAYTASTVALFFPQLGWECFFDEPVMLLGFILLGRTLEQQARSRAAIAFQSLLALRPTLARLIQEGSKTVPFVLHPANSVEIPAAQVQVGAWLQVLPGEKIPVDGEVVAGQTTINEAMLTGEAMPVLKQPGDPVMAGSLNQSGAIALKTTRTGKDTMLAQIIALVEAAQTRKAPIQGLADTVAGYFTYGVMAIALLTFLFWYLVGVPLWHESLGEISGLSMDGLSMDGHAEMMHSPFAPPLGQALSVSPLLLSLKLAIAVLVIACPCALGLATPTAILVGSGVGAERGLLIRGGDVLEKVHQLQTVVFDKTGTLTTGHPAVTDCLPLQENLSESDLLAVAATVESGARHPLAEAIQQAARQQGLASLPAQNFYTEPGFGVSAEVAGQQVILGTHRWLVQQSVEVTDAAQQQAEALAAAGKTAVYVAVEGVLAGLIGVQDTLRSDAKATVDQLRQMGLRVVLLTGDQRTAAEAIAASLGLSAKDVFAEVQPDGKAAAIAHLQQQGQVAMVGDGINDAPALAQADVGISLNSATDVAIEAAEIVLMRDRLTDVVESIQLSRATFNKIRQNLFWAFAYNLLGIPIAAGALLPSLGLMLSPATAGAFMAFSSVSVVTNSLLLRRQRRSP